MYQRTPIWVLPKVDIPFPPAVQRLFAKVPLTQRTVRWYTDTILEFSMVITMWKYRYFKLVNKAISRFSEFYRLLLVRDRELSRKLNPDFDFGCKRPTISNDYYRAFTKPHVHLETIGIERIEPDGIVARDGTKRLVDTLVLATGFDVWEANLPAIEVIGRELPRPALVRKSISPRWPSPRCAAARQPGPARRSPIRCMARSALQSSTSCTAIPCARSPGATISARRVIGRSSLVSASPRALPRRRRAGPTDRPGAALPPLPTRRAAARPHALRAARLRSPPGGWREGREGPRR